MKTALVISIVSLTLLMLTICNAGDAPNPETAEPVKRLLADASGARKKAQNELLAARPGGKTPPAITVKGEITDVKSLLELRQKMIVKLIEVVKAPAKTPREISAKAAAVKALGKLRASEAATMLVEQIDFRNQYVLMMELIMSKMFPCVGALREIGKPGSRAAMKAIGELRLEEDALRKMTKDYRKLMRLMWVVVGVEGLDVTEFLLKAKMKKAPPQFQETFKHALKILGPKDRRHMRSHPVRVENATKRAVGKTLPPTATKDAVTDVKTLLELREKMIVELIEAVKTPAKRQKEILAKVEAINALGKLRAVEAVKVLVEDIDFFDRYHVTDAAVMSVMFPCIGALQKIGKPGSRAALQAIGELRLEEDAARKVTTTYRKLTYLMRVVLVVEGSEVAEFILKSRMKKAPLQFQATFKQALKKLGK